MPGCECSDAPVSLPTPASTWKRIAPPWLDVEGESGAIPLGHCTNGGMVFGCCFHWWTESRRAGCPAVLRDVHTAEHHSTCYKAGRYPADTENFLKVLSVINATLIFI